jgi:tight adherence protein C
MDTRVYIASGCWGIAAALATWYAGQLAGQITYVTLADGRKQARKIPLMFKMLLPLAPNVVPIIKKPIFRKTVDATNRRITAAGFHGLISAEELLAMKMLLPITLGILWLLLSGVFLYFTPVQFIKELDWLIYLIGPLWLYIYPNVWLRKELQTRHRAIQRSLPFVLDLLTLAVEAGMDFMTALQRNVDRRSVDALGEELLVVIKEIQLGKTRREALRELSTRVDLPDLRAVVNALVQADELGVSIGSILRIQSDQIRQRRFERAERLANEAPVKMLGPLLLFIFPSVFLVLLGPMINKLMNQGL